MEDKEKLRKIIKETRLQKNIARDKISELLKIRGIKYAESSLSRYENGITESIKAEVLKGISDILGLDVIEMYKLAGLLNENEDIKFAKLNKRERNQFNEIQKGADYFFNDKNVSDEDKKKLYDSLQELYFDAKMKNKRKK
nr:MAG TPA: structural protein [Caudoviricetes sp.]